MAEFFQRIPGHDQMGGMGNDIFRPRLQTSAGGLEDRAAGADHIVADDRRLALDHARYLTDDGFIGIVAVLVGGGMRTIQHAGQPGDPFRKSVIGGNEYIIGQTALSYFIDDQIIGPDMLGANFAAMGMENRLGMQIDKGDIIGSGLEDLSGPGDSLGDFMGSRLGPFHRRIAEKGDDDADRCGVPIDPAGDEVKQFLMGASSWVTPRITRSLPEIDCGKAW